MRLSKAAAALPIRAGAFAPGCILGSASAFAD
jgi:hypothetical protein